MNFYIGQIFTGTYPPESADWCNNNNAFIEEITATSSGERRFQIKEIPQPTEEEIANSVRSERDNRLNQTNWLVERHQEQLTLGSTTLSSEEYLALLAYRQALRDVPQQEGFPTDIQWPEELPFLE